MTRRQEKREVRQALHHILTVTRAQARAERERRRRKALAAHWATGLNVTGAVDARLQAKTKEDAVTD